MPQLTTQQAADRLGVTRARVHQLMAEGRLKATKLGRDWLIEERDLRAVAVRKVGRPLGYSPGRKPTP